MRNHRPPNIPANTVRRCDVMYKIMFADDEALILRRLHQVIYWNALGLQILPDSLDGASALKKAAELHPDILICDINMPNMSGLELIEAVKRMNSDIYCILLTVNDSFGCVQQALNIGADNYLLKPIDPVNLMTLIKKILHLLDSSWENRNYIDSLQKKAVLNERMIREKFLNWLVSGRQPLNSTQLEEKFRFYHVPIEAQEFQILSVHIRTLDPPQFQQDHSSDLLQTATKIIEDSLDAYSNWVVFSDSFSHINVLLGFSKPGSIIGPSTDFIAQMVRDNLLFHLNVPSTIFYSRKYQGIQNIYRCYYDTKFLSQRASQLLHREIISFDEYLQESSTLSIPFDNIRSETLKYLRGNRFEGLCHHIRTVLQPYSSYEYFENFNMLRIDFVMTGIMFLQENKIALYDIFPKHYVPLTLVLEKNTPAECFDFLTDYYQHILEYIESNRISSGSRISEKCIELIEDNIASPELSVKWLGSQLYISENYLSRLFKTERGISLIKFIMQKKMEVAKKYLDEGYTNLQQISQLSGFADSLYFSKCFKKYYGLTPSRYIESRKF